MRLEVLIGLTFLKNVRRTKLLSFITCICVFGIAIGVAALIAVQSVMDGMQNQMKTAILGSRAHIKIERRKGGIENYEEILEKVSVVPGIKGITPVMEQEVMVAHSGDMTGGVAYGIDVDSLHKVSLLPEQIVDGSIFALESREACSDFIEKTRRKKGFDMNFGEKFDHRCIAVGKELSAYFAVSVGDRIDIISPVGGGMGPTGPLPLNKKFTVSAIFHSGMYEYDFGFLYMGLSEAQYFFSRENKIDAINITVDNMYRVEKQQDEIAGMLGEDVYLVKNWKTMNSSIFGALKMEKVVWFLIMGFVILVASFNIISMLTMLVIEKNREISILKCIGMSNSSVMKIFMFDGVLIGLTGTVAGIVAGVVLCMILAGIDLPFAKDVYYMTKIPVDMSLKTIFLVFVASTTVSFTATFYPALKAAKINPAEGVRYD